MQLDLVKLTVGIRAVFPHASVVLANGGHPDMYIKSPTNITVCTQGHCTRLAVPFHDSMPVERMVHAVVSDLSCMVAAAAMKGLRRG